MRVPQLFEDFNVCSLLSVSDGHWMVHISADTSNTIVSEISAILSDMTTYSVFFKTDISVFFKRPFCSNIDEGYMQQARWITQHLC